MSLLRSKCVCLSLHCDNTVAAIMYVSHITRLGWKELSNVSKVDTNHPHHLHHIIMVGFSNLVYVPISLIIHARAQQKSI